MLMITSLEYEEARDNYVGWCDTCSDFTREMTEPDAENYICEICGEESVCGAELALITEKFSIEDNDD